MSIMSRIKRLPSYVKQRRKDQKKFEADIEKYVSMCEKDEIFPYQKDYEFPIITEYRTSAANLDAHYFLQDIWFAQKVIADEPAEHFDIGSRVDGFLAHLLAAGVSVNMIDIRPLGIELKGLSFTQGDATDLRNLAPNSVKSLSSLHVVEHFGLGRYGDEVDPTGWVKGLKAMQRIVAYGGVFYLSLPAGSANRLHFNAHRVFEFKEAVKVLDQMELVEAAYISNYKVINVPISEFDRTVLRDDFACACYIFRKK